MRHHVSGRSGWTFEQHHNFLHGPVCLHRGAGGEPQPGHTLSAARGQSLDQIPAVHGSSPQILAMVSGFRGLATTMQLDSVQFVRFAMQHV